LDDQPILDGELSKETGPLSSHQRQATPKGSGSTLLGNTVDKAMKNNMQLQALHPFVQTVEDRQQYRDYRRSPSPLIYEHELTTLIRTT